MRPPWILLLPLFLAGFSPVAGQSREESTLGDLVRLAETRNPEVQAARNRVEAAAARIPVDGALPDPMVTLGLMNLPAWSLDLESEGMSMGVVQLGQRLPAPGVRGVRTELGRHRREELRHGAAETLRSVEARIAEAYFQLLYIDEARQVLERTRALLAGLVDVATARMSVGAGEQADVLRAQTEFARIDSQMSELLEERARAQARINRELDRASGTEVIPIPPPGLARILEAELPAGTFTAIPMEGNLGDDLPSLSHLQEDAATRRPILRAAEETVQQARLGRELAHRQRFPEVEVMVGYGLRRDRDDLWSASVSVGVPVFLNRKQRPAVEAAAHSAAAATQEQRALVARVRTEVADAYAETARARERFRLLDDVVVPQSEAAVENTLSAYQSDRIGFLSALDALVTLFRSETERARSRAEVGRAAARLELAAGVSLLLDDVP
jgi:outer membrane protein, heavy metal efflux system